MGREITFEDLFADDEGNEDEVEDEFDYEFVWGDQHLLNGQDILPPIHNQVGDTCVFHAITFAAEMELRRLFAEREPPETTDIIFNTDALVAQYEKDVRMHLGQDQGRVGWHHRQATAFKLFRRDGVLARSSAWEGERPLYISSHRVLRNALFEDVAYYIEQGRPVLGIMPLNHGWVFDYPGQIYEHRIPDPVRGTHMVSFVGFGRRQGRDYLVAANSAGNEFGENGLGRVYFHSLYHDEMYVVNIKPPSTASATGSSVTPSRYSFGSNFHAGSSSSNAPDSSAGPSNTAPDSSPGPSSTGE